MPIAAQSPVRSRLVDRRLDKVAAYSWRLVVIGAAVLAALWLLRQVRVVVFPIVIAVFFTRALSPVSGWLRRHRWRPGLASAASMAALALVVFGLVALAVPTFADELSSIGPTLTTAVDDVEDWLVEDGPIQVSRESVDRLRERAGDQIASVLRSSDGSLTDRATLVAEVITGLVLAVILTFFMLRDGRRFSEWLCRRAPAERRSQMRRCLTAAWSTLAAYLRGATLLGVVEAVLIGATLLIAGGRLVVPVMIVTFLGAYVPLIGAVAAGLVATLVALATGGTTTALAVAVVAIIVQQLDNDLLAPIIYGRALHLHPVAILISVVAGGALFGVAGTLLAVPVVAVSASAIRAFRDDGEPTAENGQRLPLDAEQIATDHDL